MNWKVFFRKMFFIFIMIQAGITLIMGTIGMCFMKDSSVPYVAFFFPFLFALLCMIPEIIFYTEKELSVKRVLFQKIMTLFLCEFIVLSIQKLFSPSTSNILMVAIGISVALLSFIIQGIIFLFEKGKANQMNQKLKDYRRNKKLANSQ